MGCVRAGAHFIEATRVPTLGSSSPLENATKSLSLDVPRSQVSYFKNFPRMFSKCSMVWEQPLYCPLSSQVPPGGRRQ